ncbi:isoaspartyl peptidase/L-asparaginase [bacterium]|nr:isoaspartyl peptidase/L-asparaginase [bacterium]
MEKHMTTLTSQITRIALTLVTSLLLLNDSALTQPQNGRFALAIHGGAGTIAKERMTSELEKAYRDKLQEALLAGYGILREGRSSMDAVVAVIKILEDAPLFNAGKGAVFTGDATHELDASIMDGRTLEAGAIASVKHIKNPITLARLVLEESPHVMMVGDGAEEFAVTHNLERVSQYYFFTERRWKNLQKKKAELSNNSTLDKESLKYTDKERGTVGAVALDRSGNLAAATSTGGMNNKMFGRVGDSPIIGAGTYANNETCAVSGTGHGEYFMRLLVAYDIHALMAYQGKSLQQAADMVIMKKLSELGGTGGVIAIDRTGNVAMPFNTQGMYRGYMVQGNQPIVKIYKD